MTITYRWLGVAGLELSFSGYTLLVDPFFTRPGILAVVSSERVRADAALSARYAPKADGVLVTHPHYDHLLDVPEILARTGASAWGSPNTCGLLALQGIPAEQLHCAAVGDQFALGPFSVEVFPAHHTAIPFSRWLNGSLPPHLRMDGGSGSGGILHRRRGPRLPLRLGDYRMDACYSYRIHAGGVTLLVGNHPVAADVLFFSPYHFGAYLAAVLRGVQPRQVIPIHWDDFTRPLSQPILPMLITPAQGLRPFFPPVRRIRLDQFARTVQSILPHTQVTVPVIFESCLLEIPLED